LSERLCSIRLAGRHAGNQTPWPWGRGEEGRRASGGQKWPGVVGEKFSGDAAGKTKDPRDSSPSPWTSARIFQVDNVRLGTARLDLGAAFDKRPDRAPRLLFPSGRFQSVYRMYARPLFFPRFFAVVESCVL
jgi:hypothetical protein